MNTVLIITADASLRARLLRSLSAFSVFQTASDDDALKTLRLVDIDLVLRETTGPAGALSTFVSAVRERRAPLVTGEESRRSLALVLAVYESARSGRGVRIPV